MRNDNDNNIHAALSKNAIKRNLKKGIVEMKKAARQVMTATTSRIIQAQTPNDASLSSSALLLLDQKCDNTNEKNNNNHSNNTKRKRLSYDCNECIVEDKVSAAAAAAAAMSSGADTISKDNTTTTTREIYFDNLRNSFAKIGKGRDHWWGIGQYSIVPSSCASAIVVDMHDATAPTTNNNNLHQRQQQQQQQQRRRIIIVGIQPHKNPICNGLSIVFYDSTNDGIKLGRILLKNETVHRHSSRLVKNMGTNSAKNHDFNTDIIQYSSLIGMEVNKANRGEGLSKVFIALWLHICTVTNTYPRASIMNKPLISRVLMNSFNFIPQAGGRRVGLIRLTQNSNTTTTSIDDSDVGGGGREDDEESNNNNNTPHYGLYSLSTKPLQGLFTQRYLRAQNIAILDHAPPSSSSSNNSRQDETTIVFVKTGFEHPIAILDDAVDYTPPQSLVECNNEMTKYCWQNSSMKLGQQQKEECLQLSSIQRNILISKLDSILQLTTNAKDIIDNDNVGTIEYFASLMSLKYAFVPSNELPCRPTNSDGCQWQY